MLRIASLVLALAWAGCAYAGEKPAKETAGIAELLRGTPSGAIQLLHGEAAAGSARAAAYMAVALNYGWGTSIDYRGARAYAQQASESGFAAATLMRYYEFDEPLSDGQLGAAKSAANKKARQGDPLSLYYVGLASMDDVNTSDVVVGAVAAVALLALAEAIDSSESSYDDEDDDSEDSSGEAESADPSYLSDKSKKYFLQAQAAGFAPAALALGQMYETGRGFPNDAARAVDYYREATQRDAALGAKHVGRLIESGYANDPALTRQGPISWYELAASRGDADAMTRLAMIHYRGSGVPPDRAKARELLMQAAALGDSDAESHLRTIDSELAREQARERERLAQQQAAERRRQQQDLAAERSTQVASVRAQPSRGSDADNSQSAAITHKRAAHCAGVAGRSYAFAKADTSGHDLAQQTEWLSAKTGVAYVRYVDANAARMHDPTLSSQEQSAMKSSIMRMPLDALLKELMLCAADPRIKAYL